jgi:hypothetical protein
VFNLGRKETMRTTDAPETNTPEMQDAAEAAERARLSAEAQRVMDESKPTPSQAEVDAVKTGQMDHDDKEEVDNPSMPPLAEQHARLAAARNGPPRRRRAAEAEDERAPYRTREARAGTVERSEPVPAARESENKDKR